MPEHRYDLYVLADHGQAPCRPYLAVSGGRRFERWIFEQLLEAPTAAAPNSNQRSGLVRGIRARRREAPGVFQRFLNYLEEDFLRRTEPEAHQRTASG